MLRFGCLDSPKAHRAKQAFRILVVPSQTLEEDTAMMIGHFTEQPWQQPEGKPPLGPGNDAAHWNMGIPSNREHDPEAGRQLYHRYIDEKLYAEEVGFDALMLNEHHSSPFCIQGVTNVEAAILARQSKKAWITILGNILPIWDDPLWLAEQLAMIDMISHGRLISGFVRGTARESFTHNATPPFVWERFEEAHNFLIKTWTTPGPFRWEGKHYQYRYVNPWAVPLQRPHPPIWIPGVTSYTTAIWCAQHRYPYVMLATLLEPTRELFNAYHQTAAEAGYTSGPQNLGYMFKVHVEETDEKGDEIGRKYIRGVPNPFISGNVAQGTEKPWLSVPPGHLGSVRERRMNVAERFAFGGKTGVEARLARERIGRQPYEEQVKNYSVNSGTPKTVIPRIRHVLEFLRPGSVFFWDGDGLMTHDDQMRSLRLFGEEVIPAVREIGKELGLVSAEELKDGTGYDQAAWARMKAAQAQAASPAAGT
jgi:alkanesulfonate monooxygenase SsuD/methylene tetrahydromethanopterin reductase-like flavin-dependent oxidoreductase (luciferase family)